MSEPAVRAEAGAAASEPGAKRERAFNVLVEWIGRSLFRFVRVDQAAIERIRALGQRGAVVYVMRHRSWIDFLLASFVLEREGLPAPEFVNHGGAIWLRPLRAVARAIVGRLLAAPVRRRELRQFEARDRCRRLVEGGRPVLLFMRGRPPGIRIFFRRREALTSLNTGSDYLREIVHHLWSSPHEVSLVPLAVFRGRGMRSRDARLGSAVYSLQEVPTELRRLVSLLWNARETRISIGGEVSLRGFVEQYGSEGEERLVRRLARALQIFLYREERLVWGPPLLPKKEVRRRILEDPELAGVVAKLAREQKQPEAALWRQAGKYIDEMAANFHGFYFSILEFLFNRIWPRVFSGLDYSGLDRVVQCVKRHPVVLVPCHRSHFDYLILSYIFHLNYLSPPHIAAGINLSFWPLGPLFRGAGAYFIRRTFEGNLLYKTVFRRYLAFLIQEGYTQEFFIEGGRSRTGKILTPKLGVLTAIVEAFCEGIRRDLYLVPVSIQYGRVVEEEAYQRELGGAEKQAESLSALMKARKVLGRRHGTAYVTFGRPISLQAELGARKESFRNVGDAAIEQERRRFIQKLGFRLLRDVNDITVAGATSISATVLLSLPRDACRHRELVTRALTLVDFLRWQGVRLSDSLERNAAGEFRESLSFLSDAGLIQCLTTEDALVIHVQREKRLALDFYKNNTIHFFLLPSLLSDAVCRGLEGEALQSDIAWWLDLLRWEFPLPEKGRTASELERLLAYLNEKVAPAGGASAEEILESPLVQVTRAVLDNFREAYWVAALGLMSVPDGGVPRKEALAQIQKRYATALLLGEVLKPEGSSLVTLGNALSRYAELGCIATRAGKGRDVIVEPGAKFDDLPLLAERIRRSIGAR